MALILMGGHVPGTPTVQLGRHAGQQPPDDGWPMLSRHPSVRVGVLASGGPRWGCSHDFLACAWTTGGQRAPQPLGHGVHSRALNWYKNKKRKQRRKARKNGC